MYLMSKNVIIARFDFQQNVLEVYRDDLMPFVLRGNNVDLFLIRDWLSARVLPLDRVNAKVILNSLGLDQNNRLAICYFCKALSVIDCYWIKSEDDTVSTWENVNLYENDLNKAVFGVALTGQYTQVQREIPTPELTTDGFCAKAWKRHRDGLYLYKTKVHAQEHLVEVLCSDLLDHMKVNHVKYRARVIGSFEVCCCCNMTTVDESICSMYYFKKYYERNGMDLQEWLSCQRDYYVMLIVDYLLNNTDRHLGNWGVLFDTNTGEVLGLHPLFDHNLAMYLTGSSTSKVIDGMTLQECARMAKNKVFLSVSELESYVRSKQVKFRFEHIFGSLREYTALLARIAVYKSW